MQSTPAAREAHATQRLLRLPEVQRLTGLGRSSIYEQIRAGRFPRAVPLTTTARAWRADEIATWVDERTAERDAKSGAP